MTATNLNGVDRFDRGVPISVEAGPQDGFIDKESKPKSSFRDAFRGTVPSNFEMGFEADGVEDLSEDESDGEFEDDDDSECPTIMLSKGEKKLIRDA
ncbi:hypothetical protein GH714_040099 [Hevea brasiliensis]|uniref:Uncharacterized protein n=1 Tax=Hevea brasiliensis TaxID=3981 RepID=A0A6A6KNZ6_HEVBR|nr:hypothetical protein GH714_040099 [Hevea brasiliensis]